MRRNRFSKLRKPQQLRFKFLIFRLMPFSSPLEYWNSRIWHCWRYNGRSEGLIHRGFGVLIGKNGTVKLVNIAPTEAPDRFRKPA